MFLTSFSLNGFKSFKEKINIEFKDGVTTIVGPNGSGKSNIADAFRWVLGEQSIKSLRGQKSSDVIFGGTKSHAPVGVASVKMTIDNSLKIIDSPFSEITVGRKIYRNGESKFTINGENVRLKDIHELFNDTGLGRSSFSIIGQGEIDKILNARPEERRGMIEELAGIVKYRLRKEESNKKLDSTGNNLKRVEDVISGLIENYTYFKEESIKAKEYLDLSSKLEDLELSIIHFNLKKIIVELENIDSKLDIVESEAIEASTKKIHLEAKYEEEKHRLHIMRDKYKKDVLDLSELKEELNKIQIQLIKEETILSSKDEKEDELKLRVENLKDKISSLDAIYQDKLKLKEEIDLSIKESKSEIKELLNLIAIKNSSLVKLEKNIEEIKSQHFDLAKDIAVINSEIASVDDDKNNLLKKKELSLIKVNEIKDLIASVSINMENKYKLKTDCTEKLDLATKEIELLIVKENDFRNTEVEIKEKLDNINHIYNEKNAKYNALNSITNNYEGYYPGVKSLFKKKYSLNGIIDTVGNLISVKKEYEKAIEIALGASIQSIVTETGENSKSAIEYLKKEKSGRATFLPLDGIIGKSFRVEQKKFLKLKGVIGIASELVDIDSKYKLILENLLGDIIIVDNVDNAMDINFQSGKRLKIVTLEGEQFRPGGSITGGRNKNDSSILKRKGQIEDLKKELDEIANKKRNVSKELLDVQKELYPLRGIIEAKRNAERELHGKSATLNSELEGLKVEVKHLQGRLERIDINEETIGDEISGLKKEEEILIEAKRKKDNIVKKLIIDEGDLKSEITNLQGEITFVKDKHLKMEASKAALIEKELNFNESLKMYYLERSEIENNLNNSKEILDSIGENSAKRNKEITLFKIRRDALEDEINKNILDNEREESAINVLNKEIEIISDSYRAISLEASNKENAKYEIDLRKTRLEADKSNYFTNLQENFEILPIDFLKREFAPIDLIEGKKDINKFKAKINKLGNVNVGAIDEFEKIDSRLTFLSSQKDDLNKSIESLKGVIEEINETMSEKFIRAFADLNDALKETYSAIFKGGEAYMELTDKRKPLETGVEIFSRPPGKTPKNLNLLSGGERALTAMALLFAIIKIKPSPLCIVDEADASLDERNVINFANYVNAYAKKTQFIVISHRQGMIERSDTLYGITMNKTGVSKVVSVDLKK